MANNRIGDEVESARQPADDAAESGQTGSQPASRLGSDPSEPARNAPLTPGEPMDDNAAYDAAKNDPVAALILDALHKQDANTYHGNSGGDMGRRALVAAADVREVVGKEERQRLASLLEGHRGTLTEFVDGPDKMLGLVILLLGLDKP